MSSEGCQVQNVLKYIRKTHRKDRRDCEESESCYPRDSAVAESRAPHSEARYSDTPACSCGTGPDDGEIASILHKKCAVITLAEQQLRRLMDGTDRLFCDSNTRSLYTLFCKCRNALAEHNMKCQCILVVFIIFAFFSGLILGAGTCGTYLGQFDSPILTCIDNIFIRHSYSNIEETFIGIT